MGKGKAELIVLEGPSTGNRHRLGRVNTLGSAENNTIVLKDHRIPEYCISIMSKTGRYKLQTLVVNKYIQINSLYVKQKYLEHGDILSLAGNMLLYLEHETVAADSCQMINIPLEALKRPNNNQVDILLKIDPLKSAKDFFAKRTSNKSQHRLHTLLNVSTAIGKISNLDELLNKILDAIFQEFLTDKSFILVVNPENRDEIKAFSQRSQKNDLGQGKSITRKVLQQKISMLYTSDDAPTDQENFSCMSVPLHSKGKFLGLIQIESSTDNTFSEEDLEQLQKIAMQAALAIENAQTHHHPLLYRKQLIELQYISQWLSSYMERDKIINEAASSIALFFKCSRVSVLLLDAKKNMLKIVSGKGLDPAIKNTFVSFNQSVAGKVFVKNKPLIIHNTLEIPESLRKNVDEGKYQTQSCILSPIQITSYQSQKKHVVGVICATDKLDQTRFSTLDRDLLYLLANRIGVALRNAELYEKATIDPLTKLYSRIFFFQCLQKEISNTRNNQIPLSLLLFDLDHFKMINDTYTHTVGDKFLEQMGKLLQTIMKKDEIAGRYGGEEFVMLLHCNHEEALERANELRLAIKEYPFKTGEKTIHMTSSLGVSTLRTTDAQNLLVQRADQALYIAKRCGRNRVTSENEIDQYDFPDSQEERLA